MDNYYIFNDDISFMSKEMLSCASKANTMWQGGNQWSAFDTYLTFFRYIAKFDLDYSKYDHWEKLALHSGPRIVHKDFCIISDRPEIIKVDEDHRPHCEDGPFCRWRDGSAIYAWHGTYVPAKWIECRDEIDPMEILRETDVEKRAAGMAILGHRMLPALYKRGRAKIIDDSGIASLGKLVRVNLGEDLGTGLYLVAECPRNGTIMEGVPNVSEIDGLPIETAIAAQAWRIGDPASEYQHPPRRT
jgi:hypothetical protein